VAIDSTKYCMMPLEDTRFQPRRGKFTSHPMATPAQIVAQNVVQNEAHGPITYSHLEPINTSDSCRGHYMRRFLFTRGVALRQNSLAIVKRGR
jgi:hypothetical protein